MTPTRTFDDAGQAFPIYITVVAGLLFLAFAYLAVGQAAANRNGAETAADAAALAAAQNRRDQLADKWKLVVRDPTKWQEIFDGNVDVDDSCWRAYQLADHNDATVNDCELDGLLSFTVSLKTSKPVGNSVVPGTENMHSTATATAVIEPLCWPPTGGETGDDTPPQLKCKDNKAWDVDPDDPTGLPKPQDLFDVHLADSQANDE
ncbi:pilus assembly protein TadG-related protein [Streptomyces sp. NPDC046915]|uniref:pilus assembly protein TadG-related protein n=1 Tax=Streptomyces sp. NPDC046915 TaxID=3155257 RepID=UPI0033F6633B